MNDFTCLKTGKTIDYLNCQPWDELERKSWKVAQFQEIEKWDMKHLKNQTYMILEYEIVGQFDNMIPIDRMLLQNFLENFNLCKGLGCIRGLILDNLDCMTLLSLLVDRKHHLPKGTLSQELQDLILLVFGWD